MRGMSRLVGWESFFFFDEITGCVVLAGWLSCWLSGFFFLISITGSVWSAG